MRAIMIIAALPLAACTYMTDNDKPGIPGSGSGGARAYQVTDFTAVALRGSDDVDVKVGAAFSVRAEGSSDVLDRLKIEKDGDTLKIGRRNRMGVSWDRDTGAKIYVTMPRIVAAQIAGSGDMTIDRVQGGDFKAETAGSGSITLSSLTADTASFAIAGSGGVKASGTAKTVRAEIAGSGDVDAKSLKANGADVSIAGSGSVGVDVNGDAKVSIMGSGDVDLGPNARCKVSKMGSGTVHCGG